MSKSLATSNLPSILTAPSPPLPVLPPSPSPCPQAAAGQRLRPWEAVVWLLATSAKAWVGGKGGAQSEKQPASI